MTETSPSPVSVEVMWRPGCPFCNSLRKGLSRAGLETVEHDIWSSAEAAARVRRATGGDETVPTVFVGGAPMVNPSTRQVVAAVRAADPNHHGIQAPEGRAADGAARRPSAGFVWTVLVAAVWTALAAWRPDTTWHLAPLLLAAAWPWVAGQDTSPGDVTRRGPIVLAAGAGLVTAVALTAALSVGGLLDGPTWAGSAGAAAEALVLAASGAAVAAVVGLMRTKRRQTSATARLGTTVVTSSDDIVTVEGNAYFPLAAVPDDVLRPSTTTAVCPWKGVASYYDVHVDGQLVPDGAFTYRHPLPLARRIKGRVAFWNGIEIRAERTRSSPS